MTAFVDSNTWCYYFDSSAEEHEEVSGTLEEIVQKEEVYMNTVVVMEVAHYLVKNLGAVKGKEKLEQMLEFPFKIVELDFGLTTDSVEKLAEYTHTGIGGRDATIVAAMKEEDIERIVTHDQAFKEIEELEVIDPVG